MSVLLGLLLVAGCTPGTGSPGPGSPGPEDPGPDNLDRALTRLAQAWAAGDESAAADLADPRDAGARELLALPARNVRALGLSGVALDEVGPGQARLSWRVSQRDSGLSRVEVRVRTVGRGLAIAPSTTSPAPLWLSEPRLARMDRGPVTVLGDAEQDLVGILGDARRALRDLRRSWPAWQGMVVVEVASSQQRMAAALGRPATAYDGIAAVTSSSDGTSAAATPVHVFINPLVYAGMSAQAARVVMTHELVHVATRAPVTPVPLWWAEGVAEYVGFAGVRSPGVRRLAAAASEAMLAQVARHGAPRRLPGSGAFAGPNRDAAYASARVAVAVLVELAGRSGGDAVRALTRFQAKLAAGTDPGAALRAVFGIGRRELVRRWQAELVRLSAGRAGRPARMGR